MQYGHLWKIHIPTAITSRCVEASFSLTGEDKAKLLHREGAYQLVSEMFYREVVQAVLLFGTETWVLSVTMTNTVEGVHMGFLGQVMGKTAKQQ